MSLRRRGRIIIAILALILIGIFLPPWINVSRFRSRIAKSISNAVGRPTTIDSVRMRLLPQPGFDLGGVTIADDPHFGSEPMLHADQVTATLRLTSLWRGRFEVAKLSFQYPSLNLARAADGRWNIETLLEHASHIPTAPTTKTRPESRPRFPYIEAESGRINFKLGYEKMVYSLADADFALWLASENEARARLTARMVRTDSYLSDTGTFTFEGRFQRAWNLRDTPMSVNASIENAQLGQLTKLLDGLDRGWRGAVNADVSLNGTPSALKVSTRADITDFRRYDITTLDRVRLEARCAGVFSSATSQLSDISCRMPMSDGAITLTGTTAGGLDLSTYDLALSADKVPLQQLVAVVRHAKKNIPDDVSTTGTVTANFALRKSAADAPLDWSGSGTTTDSIIRAGVMSSQLSLKPIEFEIKGPQAPTNNHRGHASKTKAPAAMAPSDFHLEFKPVSLALGGTTPATLTGWVGLGGYNLSIAGDSTIPRVLEVGRTAGLRTPQLDAEGIAKMDLLIAGQWAGHYSPKPIGTVQLSNVKVRMKGVAAPLALSSATLKLDKDSLTASNIAGSFTDSHLGFAGSVQMPRECETIEACPVQFDLRADQVSTDELNRLFNPRVAKRPWYAILGRRPEPSIFGSVNATGNLNIVRLNIKSVVANRLTAKVHLESGRLALTNVQCDLWGGKHTGQWIADFSGSSPQYSGEGSLSAVAMPQLASLMKDNWATGTANVTYTASLNGFTASELLSSASGDMNFDWRKGAFRHVSLTNTNTPLNFTRFSGTLLLRDGKLSLSQESKLSAQSGVYMLSGTASLGRQLDLSLRNGSHAYTITGTLEKPKVEPAVLPESRASLQQ